MFCAAEGYTCSKSFFGFSLDLAAAMPYTKDTVKAERGIPRAVPNRGGWRLA